MKIALLLTGNELMSGDTVDTNSSYLAQSLKDLGLIPAIKQVVGDDLELLTYSIKDLASRSDILVINGGLGPTVDDLTAVALARASQSELVSHSVAMTHLQEWADRRGFTLTPSNLKQANLPVTCDVIPNPNGSAVGFSLVLNDCLVLCTPGVPSEFKPMVENEVLPRIRKHAGIRGETKISRLRLFGISESGLQDIIDAEFPEWPSNVELGFRVQLPVLELKVATIGQALDKLNEHWTERLKTRFSDNYLGDNDMTLARAHNSALQNNGLCIVTAESCTGGLIASQITSEAGSSNVFRAGYVVYSNEMKESMLGVQAQTLDRVGAVSEETVLEMAKGALKLSNADLAVAVSGIAGPDGGTPDKPVGTVYIAFGSASDLRVRKLFLPMHRVMFQRMVTAFSLDLLRRFVSSITTDVDYYSELRRKT